MSIIVDEDLKEKPPFIKIADLHNKPNFIFGFLIDENGVVQCVCNTDDEARLSVIERRTRLVIDFVMNQKELRRQATRVQPMPADVLQKLRG